MQTVTKTLTFSLAAVIPVLEDNLVTTEQAPDTKSSYT